MMNCGICKKPFNHSDRQPYILSCPHTFCLHCINHLKKSACPNCNVAFTDKHLNSALLEMISSYTFIPKSNEEILRPQIEQAIDEIEYLRRKFNEKSDVLKNKLEKLDLNQYNSVSLKDEIKKSVDQLKDFNKSGTEDQLSHSEPAETIEDLVEKAKTLKNKKEYKNAIISLDKAIKLNPNNPSLYIEKGDLFNDLNDMTKEIECYEEAIKLNSGESTYHFKKCEALKDLERFDEAIQCIEEAIQLNSKKADYFLIKGLVLRELSKYKEALVSLNEAIKRGPNDAEIYYAKAQTLIDLNRKKEAVEAFKQAIEIKKDFLDAHIEIAYLLDKMCQEPEALEYYNQALKLSPNDSSIYNNKGLMLFNQKNPDNRKAIECFDKAIQLAPEESEYHYNKALASFYIDRFDCVIESVNKSMELGLINAAAFDLKGMALKKLKRFNEALIELDKALKYEKNISQKKEYSSNKRSILIEKEKEESLRRNLTEDMGPQTKRSKRNN